MSYVTQVITSDRGSELSCSLPPSLLESSLRKDSMQTYIYIFSFQLWNSTYGILPGDDFSNTKPRPKEVGFFLFIYF